MKQTEPEDEGAILVTEHPTYSEVEILYRVSDGVGYWSVTRLRPVRGKRNK